ncbi:Aste57867_3313 [Aphanomyces stellatus]|nr:hypothetical protein As57867_003303 [Aphanomyces stellatus]KAF0719076.1 hypothetical protein As57867_001305 [Aphanomyces stellatus]VFT78525.1 Aste57867_1306 [Aphanomyces stellatus]VFT80483.1 Aste57867_3313 [Aphanomyces stellatus]
MSGQSSGNPPSANVLLEKVLASNNALLLRLDRLEGALAKLTSEVAGPRLSIPASKSTSELKSMKRQIDDKVAHLPDAKKTRGTSVSLHEAWDKWFMSAPPMYASKGTVDRQTKAQSRAIVAFMRLFVNDNGYVLDPSQIDYRSTVMEVGLLLESRATAFLRTFGSTANVVGPALKALR